MTPWTRRNPALPLVVIAVVGGSSSCGDRDGGSVGGVDVDTFTAPDSAVETTDAEDTMTDAVETDTAGTSTGDPCRNPGTAGATATCLRPTMSPEYYVEQANRYFDTLDVEADPLSIPEYSEFVARWEWPPWLLLTGYGRQDMIDVSVALRAGDPSTVPTRDCRYFPEQPFARCFVVFEYEGGPCPIYEEFVFNDAGEMTFIEAWSDLPGLRPQPDGSDPFGERGTFYRLSTRVPGLGTPDGTLDLDGPFMAEAGLSDPAVADFAIRVTDWWAYWLEVFTQSPPDFFATGCGWSSDTP